MVDTAGGVISDRRMPMNRILLINDNASHNNWGAQATAYAVKKLFKDHLPDHQLVSIPWEWLRSEYRQWVLVGGRRLIDMSHLRRGGTLVRALSLPTEFFPKIADDFEYWVDRWNAGHGGPFADDFISWAGESTAVVHNAENSIYFNMPEGCRALFLLWFAKTSLRRPCFSINQTAHLTGVWPIMDAMAQKVYPLLDSVTTREPMSLRNLEYLGITNAQFVPDVVFSLRPEDFDTSATEKWLRSVNLRRQQFFCLSTSGLPTSRPRTGWEGEVARVVRDLKGQGLQAVLVAKDSHCQFLREVADLTDSVFFGPEHEFWDLWPLFSEAAFVVTGHLHYASFAAMVGCPILPLSANNHKMTGLCEGLKWPIQSPHNITSLSSCREDILNQAQVLVNDRPSLSRHLMEVTGAFRSDAFLNVHIIARELHDDAEIAEKLA